MPRNDLLHFLALFCSSPSAFLYESLYTSPSFIFYFFFYYPFFFAILYSYLGNLFLRLLLLFLSPHALNSLKRWRCRFDAQPEISFRNTRPQPRQYNNRKSKHKRIRNKRNASAPSKMVLCTFQRLQMLLSANEMLLPIQVVFFFPFKAKHISIGTLCNSKKNRAIWIEGCMWQRGRLENHSNTRRPKVTNGFSL